MKTKRLAVITVIFSAIVWLTGCGAYFGNEAQYDKGDWYLLASAREVARIKQDKLALKKIDEQAAAEGQAIRFPGVILNKSAYRDANFVVSGPETKGFYLAPSKKENYDLTPGVYVATLYDENGYVRGKPWIFHVDARKHSFLGEKVHWYLIAPP